MANRETGDPPVRDRESYIRDILLANEPFECQECCWKGRTGGLKRHDENGTVALSCPECGQDHYMWPPT